MLQYKHENLQLKRAGRSVAFALIVNRVNEGGKIAPLHIWQNNLLAEPCVEHYLTGLLSNNGQP